MSYTNYKARHNCLVSQIYSMCSKPCHRRCPTLEWTRGRRWCDICLRLICSFVKWFGGTSMHSLCHDAQCKYHYLNVFVNAWRRQMDESRPFAVLPMYLHIALCCRLCRQPLMYRFGGSREPSADPTTTMPTRSSMRHVTWCKFEINDGAHGNLHCFVYQLVGNTFFNQKKKIQSRCHEHYVSMLPQPVDKMGVPTAIYKNHKFHRHLISSRLCKVVQNGKI